MTQDLFDDLKAARGPATVEVPEELRERVLRAAFAEPEPRARRRRLWGRSLPVVAAGMLCVTGAAVAAGVAVSEATKDRSAVLAGQTEVDTGGKETRDAELSAELERLRAVTPYPPGVRDAFPEAALQGVAVGSVRVVVEQRANCFWQQYWAQSAAAGDERAMADAAVILRQSTTWPTFKLSRGEGHQTAAKVAEQAERGAGQLAAFKERMAGQCAGVLPAH